MRVTCHAGARDRSTGCHLGEVGVEETKERRRSWQGLKCNDDPVSMPGRALLHAAPHWCEQHRGRESTTRETRTASCLCSFYLLVDRRTGGSRMCMRTAGRGSTAARASLHAHVRSRARCMAESRAEVPQHLHGSTANNLRVRTPEIRGAATWTRGRGRVCARTSAAARRRPALFHFVILVSKLRNSKKCQHTQTSLKIKVVEEL
jgi:hypothetical protein